jgi:hypothetical protein
LSSSTRKVTTTEAERFFGTAQPPHLSDDYLVALYFDQKRIGEFQWIAAIQFRQEFITATWDYRSIEGQHPGWTLPTGPQLDSKDRVKRALSKVPEDCSAVLLAACGLGCGRQGDDEEIALLSNGLNALAKHFQSETGGENHLLEYYSTWVEESHFEPVGRRFAIIPDRAVSDQRLTSKAFRLLSALGIYCDRDGCCSLTIITLANRIELDPRDVIKGLQILQDTGYLQASQQPDDRVNALRRYKILYDTKLPVLEKSKCKRRGRKPKPGARRVALATRYLHWRLREAGAKAPRENALAEISERTGIPEGTIERWIREF